MAIAYSANQTFDYVLEEDRDLPTDQQTIWKLRYLSSLEMSHVMDHSMPDAKGGVPANYGSLQIEVLKAGLSGWSNFCDADGEEVIFERVNKKERILSRGCFPGTMATLDRINPVHKGELVNKILDAHNLTDDESKN